MDYFLTIAASDNSGGAGIQQDCKVAHELGYWALSAVTGITAQNFNKTYAVEAVSGKMLEAQLQQSIHSFPVKAIKIGAICNKENIAVIANHLNAFSNIPIVLDPVLSATSGASFLDNSSLHLLKETLFPLTRIITPNKPEFELLVNQQITTIEEGIEIAKEKCKEWETAILLKGGHFDDALIKEALITKHEVLCFERERKNYTYNHGTGCTLSSALACFLGNEKSLKESYYLASNYLTELFDNLQIKLLR